MSGKRITNSRIERIEKKLELVDETQDIELEVTHELRSRLDELEIQVGVMRRDEDLIAVVNGRITRLHLRLDRIESVIPNPGVLRRGAGVLGVLLILLANSYLIHNTVTYKDSVPDMAGMLLSGLLGIGLTVVMVSGVYLIGELITYVKEG